MISDHNQIATNHSILVNRFLSLMDEYLIYNQIFIVEEDT
jgi:hypothetical protein